MAISGSATLVWPRPYDVDNRRRDDQQVLCRQSWQGVCFYWQRATTNVHSRPCRIFIARVLYTVCRRRHQLSPTTSWQKFCYPLLCWSRLSIWSHHLLLSCLTVHCWLVIFLASSRTHSSRWLWRRRDSTPPMRPLIVPSYLPVLSKLLERLVHQLILYRPLTVEILLRWFFRICLQHSTRSTTKYSCSAYV